MRRPVARHVDGLDVAEGLEGHLDHVGRRVRAQLLRLAGAVGRQVDLRRLAAHVAQPVVVAAARGVRVVVREREEAVEVAREVQPLDLVGRGVVRRDAAVGVVRVVALIIMTPELREEDVQALAAARRRQVPERRAGGLLGLDRERVRPALEELRDLGEAVVDLVVAGPRRQLERRHVADALEERDRVRAEGLAVRRLVAPRDVHPADVEVVRREGLLPGLRRVHAAEAGAELRLGREAQPHVDVADAQVHAHDLLLVDDAGHAHAEGRAARRRLRRRRARARRDRERRARQHAAAQQIEGLDLEGVEGVRREAGDLVVEHVRRVRAVVDEDRGRARQHRLDVDVRAVVVVVGARVHEAARRRAHERHVARLGVERDHPLEAAEGVRLVARHRDDRDGLQILELGLDGDGVGVHGDRDRLLAAEGQRERARQLVRAGEEALDRHVVGVGGGVGVDLGLVDGHEGHLAPAVERDRLVGVAVHAVVARDVDALVARRLSVVAADGVGDGVLPLRVRRRPLEGLGPLAVDVEAHDGVELRVLEEDALALGRRAVRVDDDALDLLLDRVRVRHRVQRRAGVHEEPVARDGRAARRVVVRRAPAHVHRRLADVDVRRPHEGVGLVPVRAVADAVVDARHGRGDHRRDRRLRRPAQAIHGLDVEAVELALVELADDVAHDAEAARQDVDAPEPALVARPRAERLHGHLLEGLLAGAAHPELVGRDVRAAVVDGRAPLDGDLAVPEHAVRVRLVQGLADAVGGHAHLPRRQRRHGRARVPHREDGRVRELPAADEVRVARVAVVHGAHREPVLLARLEADARARAHDELRHVGLVRAVEDEARPAAGPLVHPELVAHDARAAVRRRVVPRDGQRDGARVHEAHGRRRARRVPRRRLVLGRRELVGAEAQVVVPARARVVALARREAQEVVGVRRAAAQVRRRRDALAERAVGAAARARAARHLRHGHVEARAVARAGAVAVVALAGAARQRRVGLRPVERRHVAAVADVVAPAVGLAAAEGDEPRVAVVVRRARDLDVADVLHGLERGLEGRGRRVVRDRARVVALRRRPEAARVGRPGRAVEARARVVAERQLERALERPRALHALAHGDRRLRVEGRVVQEPV